MHEAISPRPAEVRAYPPLILEPAAKLWTSLADRFAAATTCHVPLPVLKAPHPTATPSSILPTAPYSGP